MEISLDNSQSRYLIRSYEPGKLCVNEEVYTSSIILTPETLQHPWTPNHYSALTKEALNDIILLAPQIVLIGTGENNHFIPMEWLILFYQKNIGVEVMNTAAACRTFNVLASEKRKVAAGLLIL